MQNITLGNLNKKVSRICFGALTLGGLQAKATDMTIKNTVAAAIDHGINFFDTAEIYESHHIVRQAITLNPDLVVSSKSYAYEPKQARLAVENCMREIGRDYIDIFLLHETIGKDTIYGHMPAIDTYLKLKQEGKIGHFGYSTHHIQAVKDVVYFPQVEILHAIINYKGLGIVDGDREQMETAIAAAHARGIGFFAMKAFGGGHLLADRVRAARYFDDKPYIDCIALGMQSPQEVKHNVELFMQGSHVPAPDIKSKKVQIMDWCQICGNCQKICPQNAISMSDKCAIIDESKCVLCGYCGSGCKELAIKIF